MSGGLAGLNESNITYSHATGTVTLNEHGHSAGGLVGGNGGSIAKSYSTSTVTGKFEIGGLVGGNGGKINNCYFVGKIMGQEIVGGIVGLNYESGTTSNNYSIGEVTGERFANGLAGDNDGKQAKRSFYNRETSGSICGWGIEGKTTAEMKQIATYCDAGWNFDKIWSIDSEINDGYPYLRRMRE